MAKAEKFEDLVIFQKARELCKDVYRVTSNEPWKYDSRFVQQIHAAAGSIMDNILKVTNVMAIRSSRTSCIYPKDHVGRFALK